MSTAHRYPESFFRLQKWDYRRTGIALNGYGRAQSFGIRCTGASYHRTLEEAEHEARRTGDGMTCCFTVSELTFGIPFSAGESLSERILAPDGTVLSVRRHALVSQLYTPEGWDTLEYAAYLDSLRRCTPEEIGECRFKSGDIVEIVSCDSNPFFLDGEVNLGIVATPMLSGEEHLRSTTNGACGVITASCPDSIDHAPAFCLLSPRFDVPASTAKKLTSLYEALTAGK